MRVLFVCSGNKEGGISPIVKNIGESLSNYGIDIQYFKIKEKGAGGYWRGIFKLKRELKQSSFEIIHAHYGLCGLVALIARGKEKLVISYMGSDLLRSGVTKFPFNLIYLLLKFLYRTLSDRFFDHSIVKSEQLKEQLKSDSNISICPTGVNLKKFVQVDRNDALSFTGFNPAKNHIIFVSDPSRIEKNFALAVDAVALINSDNSELHTVYNIEQENLKFYYSAADTLLLTSTYEGSPNVIKEAMACNCPVVSTDIGDVRYLFGDCPGHLIASSGKADIAEKLLNAIEFRKSKMHTEGRKRIIQLGLDNESVAKEIIDIYKKILN